MASKHFAACALLLVVTVVSSGCKVLHPHGCGSAVCGDDLCSEPVCDAPACGETCRSKYAGMKWKGSCGPCQGPKFCICTGPECHDCGPAPGCGCDPECGCEPSCVAEPGCECEGPCECGSICNTLHGCGPLATLKGSVKHLLTKVFGCGGCDGELYWSEWHNDPPRCCDPCDKCGNWIGPSASYRAPYSHPYSVAEGGVVEETIVR